MGGIDEVFARQSGSGASAQTLSYLIDALGSTVRLTDKTGAKVVDYTYDPYGNTTADAIVDNPFQYTGRENDGTGLYFYRARYYSPNQQRFISEDPIGLRGGINVYGYVGGNPVSLIDPSGLTTLVYDPGSGTLVIINGNGYVTGTFPAGNNTVPGSNGPWSSGTYGFSHYMPHPESGVHGPYGSNGNFVFDVPGRPGMGVHSGRDGPQSPTEGCIRTTEEATRTIFSMHRHDPIQSITVR